MMALTKSNASCSRCHFVVYKTQNLCSCLPTNFLLNHPLASPPVCVFLHDVRISSVTGQDTLAIYRASCQGKWFAVCVPAGVKLMCLYSWSKHCFNLRCKTFTWKYTVCVGFLTYAVILGNYCTEASHNF